ncbi:hypothetical protein ISN45_Aa07g018490 [Arabidopsis thaliana x Arabidopsis arenosa]|uniref:Uncharacterized protein n=1 Tax=Arabidopsis thaliana x Arabidopsis arenosa TaxID=1240361 RepID=A0A8T1YBY9_9BRAS|nr:hypothetical protein ISN45_Aa07g018490 [Arabidopsis thaliana x Arabidopsis arenosa]
MAETRSMLLNEAVVRETEEVLGRLEQAIAERNQQFDKRMAELREAIQLFSDQVNHSSSCGHLQQKQPRLEPDHERKQWIENFDRRRKSHEVIDSNSQEKESSVDNIVTQSKVILQHSSAPSAAFSHFQVPKYHLEPSLGCCNEPLNVFETWPSEIVRNIGVQSQSGLECVMSKNNAHQVFDRLLLRRHKFQQRRKLSLSPKSWMFKFKNMTLSRNRSQRDLHQVFDISNINNPYPCSSVNVGLVRKKRTFQRLRLTKQAHMSRVLNNMRMLHDPGGIKQLLIVDMQPEFLCKVESGEVTVITPEESKTRRLLLPISDAQFMLQEDLLVVFQDIFTVQPPFSCTDSLLHEKIPVSSLIVEEAITSFQSLTVISRELQAALQGREWGADSIIPDVVSKAVVWTSSTQNKQRKFLKTWKFKYKNVKEGIQKLQIQSRYQSLQRLDVLKMNEVGFTRDRELPIAFKDRRKVVRPDKKLIHFEVVFDMGERDEMFTVMSLFLLSSLVIQQVMRNTKIKFSKRWWFKYKYVTNGIKRLQIQLRYKCWLELKEWFKSWGIRESWRKHKKIQLFTLRIREGMEEDMMENDQQQEDSESLMPAPNFVTKNRFSPYMVVLVKPVAYATHFLVGVGMDTRQCRLSLRTYRVWDPGGFIVEDATPWWIHMFCSRG